MPSLLLIAANLARAQSYDVVAAAPVDFDVSDLGLLVDDSFRPLDGPNRSISESTPSKREFPGETRAQWIREDTTQIQRAEARIWTGLGLGVGASAEGTATHRADVAFYRAYTADSVIQLDRASYRTTAVPANAAWYVSQVYVGRMFEVVCRGERDALDAAIEGHASLPLGGGQLTLSSESSTQTVACDTRLLGLKPKGGHEGSSLQLTSTATLDDNFSATAASRVVMVQYSSIPDSLREKPPPAATPLRYTVTLVDVAFPALKPNGSSWDILGNPPDIGVRVSVGDALIWQSPVIQDTYQVTMNTDVAVGVPATAAPMVFWVFDQDYSEGDDAGAVTLDLQKVTHVAKEGESATVLTPAGVQLTLSVTPVE